MLQAKWILPLMICWAITCPATSWGEGSIELLSRAEVEVVKVNKKGEKEIVREPASKVVPGDTVIYTNTYRNAGKERADNVVINNPVPEHMNYVGGSAFGEGTAITFSADGGKTFERPEKIFKLGEDGQLRLARPEEYTHLRWVVRGELKPGSTGEVGYRARLQ